MRLLFTLLLLLATAASGAHAQSAFSGTVHMQVEDPANLMGYNLHLASHGGKHLFRLEMQRGAHSLAYSLLSEPGDAASYTYWDAYITMKIPAEQVTVTRESATYQATGNTKTILGYPCQEYVHQAGDVKKVAWVTTALSLDLADFPFFKVMGGGGLPQGFPLEATTYGPNELVMQRLSVTEVDENPPAASVFQVPSDVVATSNEQVLQYFQQQYGAKKVDDIYKELGKERPTAE